MSEPHWSAALVGDRQYFMDETYRQGHLLRRAVLPSTNWITPDGLLDDLLSLETLPAVYVRLVKAGKPVPRAGYTRPKLPAGAALGEVLLPDKVAEAFRDGATVILNYADHVLPEAKRACRALAETFAAQTELVLFLSPAGGEGLRPHTDPTDAFILQLAGSKEWRVWPGSSQRSGPIQAVDELGPPALQATLEAGDVLYLPPSTPHVALAKESTSLHATLSIEPRSWRTVLLDSAKQALADPRFDGWPSKDPALAADTGLPDRLRALADALTRLSADNPQ